MQTQIQNQELTPGMQIRVQSISDQWLIAFGLHESQRCFYEERKEVEQKTLDAEFKSSKKGKKIIRPSFKEKKVLRENIAKLINSGIDHRDDIYRALMKEGQVPRKADQYMSEESVEKHVYSVRHELNLFPKTVKQKILAMHAQGIDRKTIRLTLKTHRTYVNDCIANRVR